MKRIKFMQFAIAMLLAAPAFLTSCQEDAPEINYTMNVSVINDFTKVVEAINNGSLKNEQAIAKLTEAIDRMNTDQQTKLQAIIDVLNSVNATIETKLATIEAAMKAQTLSVEGKLDLIEKAIKALPDYSAQLEAIKIAIEALPNYGDKLTALENAIKALPNYNSKFDAVVAALNAMKTQVEALGTGQTAIATKIGEATAAINNLITSVKNGNTNEATALAQIVTKLEELKGSIGTGGTGSETTEGITTSTMEYVDLELPSGILWAKCNLGTEDSEDPGYYYAWGETYNKIEFNWGNYKWGTEGNMTKYNDSDNKTVLDAADDAATVTLGSPWRMPTKEEFQELLDYCEWSVVEDGKDRRCKVERNGKSILLPMPNSSTGNYWRGFYWTRQLSVVGNNEAACLCLSYNMLDKFTKAVYHHLRYQGDERMIRAVRPK